MARTTVTAAGTRIALLTAMNWCPSIVSVVAMGLVVSGAACGSSKLGLDTVPGPTTGFFVVAPPPNQDFTRVRLTSEDGRVVLGESGRRTAVRDLFRWTSAGDHAGEMLWIHPPNEEPTDLLGVVGLTLSSHGETVLGNVRRQDGLPFFVWTEEEDEARELTRVMEGAPLDLLGGLNEDGTALFGSSASQSFRWTARDGVRPLAPVAGDIGLRVTAISADGGVMAGNSLIDPRWEGTDNDLTRLARWTEAGGTEGLPLPPDAIACQTMGWMSADGNVIFGTCFDGATPPQRQVVRWTPPEGTVTLRRFPASTDVRIEAVSPDGSRAILGVFTAIPPLPGAENPPSHPVSWTVVGGWEDLPLPDGTTGCYPGDTTHRWASSGTVFGGCQTANGTLAAKWNNSGEVVVLPPPAGFPQSKANSISDDGRVAAGAGVRPLQPMGEETLPVVWTDGSDGRTEPRAVEELLRSTFGLADLGGVSLKTVAVSSDGRILSGEARDAQGRQVAWFARLP